jgi:hypothetical protein
MLDIQSRLERTYLNALAIFSFFSGLLVDLSLAYQLRDDSYRLKDKKKFQVKFTENQQMEKENIDKTDKTTI